jgi:site-specific recombinase XerD
MRQKRTLPREILTDAEAEAILGECGETLSGLRNRAVILLLDGTGCRIAEVLGLEPRDIDWTEHVVNVRHGKGNKQRVVPVSSRALEAVEAWMRLRSVAGIGPEAHVCCNLKGKRLSSAYVRKLLPKLATRAGVAKRVHPHGFRHRFTTRMVRKGVVVTSVSQVLGHSNLATTHLYCSRLGAGPALDDVRRALRAMDRGRGLASMKKA